MNSQLKLALLATAATLYAPAMLGAHAQTASGTGQSPNLLSGYAIRPSWQVAGVDFAVGAPTGALKDPATSVLPAGCSYASAMVTCNGGSPTISGYDFSKASLTLTNTTNAAVTGNTFGACLDPSINMTGIGGNAQISSNTFNGGGGSCGPLTYGSVVNTTQNAGSNLTFQNNYLANTPQDGLDARGSASGSATLTAQNNFYNGEGWQGHPDGIQTNGGNFSNINVSNNTYYSASNTVAGTQPLHLEAQLGGSIASSTVNNNTILTPGKCNGSGYPNNCTANFDIACKSDPGGNGNTGFTASDNFVDATGAIGALSNNYGCSGATFSGNVDITTGAQIPNQGGAAVANVPSAPASASSAPTVTPAVVTSSATPAAVTPVAATTSLPTPADPAASAPASTPATPTAASVPSLPAGACTSGTPNYAASAGGFGVLDGKFYTPDGQPFVAHGINTDDLGAAAQILAAFPGINFIRLSDYYTSGHTIAQIQAFVSVMSAHGVVVEIEDHAYAPNGDPVLTGPALSAESAWYASLASAFKTNPYVWFGTMNEPSGTGAQIAAQEVATYNAIRGAGNNNPILLEAGVGAGVGGEIGAPFLPASSYAKMTNVGLDLHSYPWQSGFSTNQSTVNNELSSLVSQAQTLKSADGMIPVIVGEFGDSTTGVAIDTGGTQTVQAVMNSGLGYAAWQWGSGGSGGGDGLTNGSGLSSYGQQVAAGIATSGATGCPVSPIPTAAQVTAANPGLDVAQEAVTAADNLSVADVASLAAQGQTADGQSIAGVAQAAYADATGSANGGTLSTDPTTAAVLAVGPAPAVQPIQRTVASPGGTMPTPAAVSNSTTFSATGNYQTVVPSPGNATGTVSGSGNTINATGGIQTITVSGPGNTITTGPYNDTITVQSAGNTINGGGGNDTVVLAYANEPLNLGINADKPALPLAGAGNIFVAPQPGTGTMTIQGVIGANDRIDLTKALAGTTWNGSPSTMLNYVGLASTSTGCTITVNGQMVVKLPNGSPGADIIPYLTGTGV